MQFNSANGQLESIAGGTVDATPGMPMKSLGPMNVEFDVVVGKGDTPVIDFVPTVSAKGFDDPGGLGKIAGANGIIKVVSWTKK